MKAKIIKKLLSLGLRDDALVVARERYTNDQLQEIYDWLGL